MAGDPITIAPMREDHLEVAVGIMARAFHDDPLFVALFPDPVERNRVMPAVSAWNFRHGLLFGTVLVAGDGPDGVAILYRSTESVFTDTHLVASLGELPEQLGPDVWDDYERMQAVWMVPEEQLAATVSEPHWYLDMVAAFPVPRLLSIRLGTGCKSPPGVAILGS